MTATPARRQIGSRWVSQSSARILQFACPNAPTTSRLNGGPFWNVVGRMRTCVGFTVQRTVSRAPRAASGFSGSQSVAHRIAHQLVDFLDRDVQPTSQDITDVTLLVEQLSAAAVGDQARGLHPVLRGPDQPGLPQRFEPRNLIVIVEIEGEFARELAVQLGHFGFELQMYERMDELVSAAGGRSPAAVILDLSAPGRGR